jgi:hypothetical protein
MCRTYNLYNLSVEESSQTKEMLVYRNHTWIKSSTGKHLSALSFLMTPHGWSKMSTSRLYILTILSISSVVET